MNKPIFLMAVLAGCQAAFPAPDGGDPPLDDAGADPRVDAGSVQCGFPSHAAADGGCETTLAWTDGPVGPAPRDHHATVVFALDGGATACVTGGVDEPAAAARNDLWCARLSTEGLGNWARGPNPPLWQSGDGADVLGDRAYLVSGKTVDSTGRLQWTPRVTSLQMGADGRPGAWRDETPLPRPRFHASANVYRKWLYVVGGLETQPSKATQTVYRAAISADGTVGAWSELAPLPEERSHHATVFYRDRIYVLSGLDGLDTTYSDGLMSTVDADGNLGPWQRFTLPFGVVAHSAAVVGSNVYVIGGLKAGSYDASAAVRRAQVLDDGSLGSWVDMTPLLFARGHVHHTPVWNGLIVSVAGNTGNHVPTDRVLLGTLY